MNARAEQALSQAIAAMEDVSSSMLAFNEAVVASIAALREFREAIRPAATDEPKRIVEATFEGSLSVCDITRLASAARCPGRFEALSPQEIVALAIEAGVRYTGYRDEPFARYVVRCLAPVGFRLRPGGGFEIVT